MTVPLKTPHHPIAVIGGGLSGLVAARVLHVHGIAAAVLDLEAGPHVRTQGGQLDVHDDTGQQALRAAGLHEEFLTRVTPGGEAMRILDTRAAVLREEADEGTLGRPEVDRGVLRDLLLGSLPEGTVRWGSKVVSARPVDGAVGRHAVELADGTSFTTDLLVGADGAWSRVRPLVSSARPAYTGISFVEVDLFDADARHPAEAAAMGAGMLFALGGRTSVLGHREGDGSLHVYLGHRCDEGWLDALDATDDAAARREVLALLDGWDPALRGLVAHADTPLTPRRIHALPVGHSWPRVPGVTLTGDAAHLMSPFAGEGANLAMHDGAQLALAEYEEDLFPRSAAAARESAESLEVIFSEERPHGLVDLFASLEDAPA